MLVPVTDDTQQEHQRQVGGQQLEQQVGICQADILSAIPASYRNKARTLLDYIIKSKQLTWNERGEIMLDQHTVHGSHIVDLLKYTLFPYKHFTPLGIDQFRSALQAINIPRSLTTQTGAGQILPPPGLPALGEDSKNKSSAWVWHKM